MLFLKAKLPVYLFKINVKNKNQNVTNTLVSVFYRNRQIVKRTDASGNISLKMLVGFVYGFGLKNKVLEKVRVIEGLNVRYFNVNEGFVKASKLQEIADQKHKKAEQLKQKEDELKRQQQKAQEEAEKAKSEAEKNQPIQNNTHTENGGKPLTTVSNQPPPTSDTTRYHIYHDGKIKRENKAATGYAEFIYYEANGTAHNLGKSAFIKANKYENYKDSQGKTQYRRIEGHSYLIDYSKHNNYKNNNVGYKWVILSDDNRHYLSGISLSAVLGAMCSLGYAEYHGSGFSKKDGSPGGSVSHINGECGDFRYIGTDNSHMTQHTYTTHNHFDWDKNVAFVEALFKFGFKSFLSKPVKIKGNIMLPRTTSWPDHHNHLQRLRANVQDI
ncbi:OmpH family outer membrane protein [Acinetobacter sp. 194]|uniref:OmpH family outer membrane protein n=1 Tax=Acinetobacter shaoyimingii TaxID=2715164 RepID=UPI001409B3DF|nr:OmpH family outer membrane protein [Acinetobacter shaoyimingii]NHB59320.1 OmpH family outer membrane protein [Acinetobacter shaoyimingii]